MNKLPDAKQAGALAPPVDYSQGHVSRGLVLGGRIISFVHVLFLALVLLPSLSAAVYYGWWASDRYVSEARLTVRSADAQTASALMGILGAFSSSRGGGTESHVVEAYVESPEIVERLQQWVDLRAIWSDPRADVVARLGDDVTKEELHEYYLERVEAVYNPTTSIIELRVQAFTPLDAQTIADSIVVLAEELVNSVSEKSRDDTMRFAADELQRARGHLQEAGERMLEFRNKHGELDPAASAGAIGELIGKLEGDLAEKQAELSSLKSFMRDDTHRVTTLRSQISSLRQQIELQRGRLAAADTPAFSTLLAEYQSLVMAEELAREAYTFALKAMETSRVEAARQQMYLVAFVPPSLPQEGTEPQRLLMFGTILLGSLICFGIVALIFTAVREHARM